MKFSYEEMQVNRGAGQASNMDNLQQHLNAVRTPEKVENESRTRKFIQSIVESLTDDPMPVIEEMTTLQLLDLQVAIAQNLKQRICL